MVAIVTACKIGAPMCATRIPSHHQWAVGREEVIAVWFGASQGIIGKDRGWITATAVLLVFYVPCLATICPLGLTKRLLGDHDAAGSATKKLLYLPLHHIMVLCQPKACSKAYVGSATHYRFIKDRIRPFDSCILFWNIVDPLQKMEESHSYSERTF